jgi:signal transduction histidine kinase/CheY-like chemotaxis protein
MLRARGTLFKKYALYLAGLVSITLIISGAMSLYFLYGDTRALVVELQQEKARNAAQQIQRFVIEIEKQLKNVFYSQTVGPAEHQERYYDLLRLLRQSPAVVDISWIDRRGVQYIKVSRLARDDVGNGTDLSVHPAVATALRGETYVSPVYFRQESEPYMTIATGGEHIDNGITLAEINLKFVWEVVSSIRIGTAGYAYVVDAEGRLLSHPDISLVLRRSDLSQFSPVRAILSGENSTNSTYVSVAPVAADGHKRSTLTVHAPISSLGWHVLVEQPIAEAFAPLYASALRTGLLLLLGVMLAIAAGIMLARRMTEPILLLQKGATRIGDGYLQEPVHISTGDELETLADQFNDMSQRLRSSYADLETKIADRTEQLAAANQAKSRFLAAASHDLRQPVHALGLYIAQLKDTDNKEERNRLLPKIEASTNLISDLLEALLDISKLDAGALQPQISDFPVQVLLNQLEANFTVAAEAKGLRLRVRPCMLRVRTDPVLLERVLMNLTANAVRYTLQGGVLIACRQRSNHIRVEVWDTGIGISADQTKRIFEEFYQAHTNVSDRNRGLGLGLAIVDRLSQLLGLQLEFRSVVDQGSVFAINIPLASGYGATGVITEPFANMRFDGAVALVVDDDEPAREAAAGLLRHWGWRVICCASGTDAAAALSDPPQRLDVIISDYRLAGDEVGTQVIQRVRDVCGANIPALVVSGDVSVEMRELARGAGLHILYKPLQAAKLRTLLHHLLQNNTEPGRTE